MESVVVDRVVVDGGLGAALEAVASGIDGLFEVGVAPVDGAEAAAMVGEVECQLRRLQAFGVEVLDAIDRSGTFIDDGYRSVKAMVGHVAKLSGAEAAGRLKAMGVCRELPEVAAAWRAGEVGTDQVKLLGRLNANRRVRDAMVDAQGWFVESAGRDSFNDFELVVREWERLIDEDGPARRNERVHEGRDVLLVQLFDTSWMLKGSCGALQGAAMAEIFERYVDAEFRADWDKARAEHGDKACAADLGRSAAQRRADGLWQVFQDAAGADASAVPPGFMHDIEWSAGSYAEMLNRVEGRPPRRLDPDDHMCQTLDGRRLEPAEAAVNSLWHHVRRAVVDASGVVIDLGRARRFTGNARLAALLPDDRCVWPGCGVAATRCEIDHVHEHAKGGATNPANAAVLCGRHNRWKQKGFTIWRDPTGRWHAQRPNGTQIE